MTTKKTKDKTMTNDKNILQAIEPTKIFYDQMGKYPDIWIIRAVHNISHKQAKEVIKLIKQTKGKKQCLKTI
jgi:hypothetical protein|tara:strand:+ start:221 stop:436 length:216 start_codon:yes stop_codon:yes gene_type:complete